MSQARNESANKFSQRTLTLNQCSFVYENSGFRLDDISLMIRAGNMYGIVGPNGSGKSTLLRVMAGIIKPGRGKVLIDGTDIKQFSRLQFARNVAFLPQQPSSSFDLRIKEVVELGRYPYQPGFGLLTRRDKEVIERALKETECEKLGDRYLSTLSGGERQRVLIASVLAQEPAILLLDEPSSSLDIHHKTHVFDLLWQLSRRDIAVVIVTHDLNMAAEFCDELILMDAGKVVQAGKPFEVMTERILCRVYEASLKVFEHPLHRTPMVTVRGQKDNIR